MVACGPVPLSRAWSFSACMPNAATVNLFGMCLRESFQRGPTEPARLICSVCILQRLRLGCVVLGLTSGRILEGGRKLVCYLPVNSINIKVRDRSDPGVNHPSNFRHHRQLLQSGEPDGGHQCACCLFALTPQLIRCVLIDRSNSMCLEFTALSRTSPCSTLAPSISHCWTAFCSASCVPTKSPASRCSSGTLRRSLVDLVRLLPCRFLIGAGGVALQRLG